MTEELTPVRCGCGGKAVLGYQSQMYGVRCSECFITIGGYDTEAEAITAWNRAMGERTAKVQPVTITTNPPRSWEQCSRCLNEVYHHMPYCPGCGARLEWDEFRF